MDIVDLARFQFAMTTVFHFFFVPFSIGTAFVVAILETFYVRTKNEAYKKLAKFWGNIFLLSFAVGVVTGLIQEFQFGMNWSDYSRFMGDIFGAPLALEALLSPHSYIHSCPPDHQRAALSERHCAPRGSLRTTP